MTTNDKEKYIKLWEDHINELYNLGLPLMDVDTKHYDKLIANMHELRDLVQIAADEDFK